MAMFNRFTERARKVILLANSATLRVENAGMTCAEGCLAISPAASKVRMSQVY